MGQAVASSRCQETLVVRGEALTRLPDVGGRVGPSLFGVDRAGSHLALRSVWRCRRMCHAHRVLLCEISLKPSPQSCSAARRARALLAPGPTLARRDAELQFFMPSSISQTFIMYLMRRSARPLRDARMPCAHAPGSRGSEMRPRHRRSGMSTCLARRLASSMIPRHAGQTSTILRLVAAGRMQPHFWAGPGLCQVQSRAQVLACGLALTSAS